MNASYGSVVEEIMRDFLGGRLGFADFVSQMRPYVEIDFRGPSASIRYRQPFEVQIPVLPAGLYPMLEAYTAGRVNEEELGNWARVIDLMPEFGQGGDVSDKEADRLDPLWDIIARLSGPPVFERVTPEAVSQYIDQLHALQLEITRDAV